LSSGHMPRPARRGVQLNALMHSGIPKHGGH
jgi:hypothetical protein